VAQWGKEQEVHGDPEQAAIMASFNVLGFRGLQEE
jgi:hypothetical protein